MEELYEACSAISDLTKEEPLTQLNKLWKKAPAKYREDEKVVKHFSELLLQLDAKAYAAKIIEAAVSKRWSVILVRRYGELDFGVSPQQLIMAEGWLKARPADANLMLCLGRISMRNELWGKQRNTTKTVLRSRLPLKLMVN